jgi:isoleucyl-tRNA synthetase
MKSLGAFVSDKNPSEDLKNKYKDSLCLPKTDFPMKGDLPQKEPIRILNWAKQNTYEKMTAKNSKLFAFPDGPPYANGNIHVGHALNKILKDIVIKYKNMTGHKAVFIPGWDCHGLPIELGVTKNLGEKRKEISDTEFRNLCREYALGWVNIQREQFKRLGILADFDHPYMTLDKTYEAEEVRQLAKMVERGVVYRGEKPVYWCWPLQTALADTEVEYAEHSSPAIFVKFQLTNKEKSYLVIWTTTPWTIPANLAVCVNADYNYSFYEHNGEQLMFADGLVESKKQLAYNLKKLKVLLLKVVSSLQCNTSTLG